MIIYSYVNDYPELGLIWIGFTIFSYTYSLLIHSKENFYIPERKKENYSKLSYK